MDTQSIKNILSNVENNFHKRKPKPLLDHIALLKKNALLKNNQAEAKDLWCLENIIHAQNHYIEAFKLLKKKKHYKAWCILERAEIDLLSLRPHVNFEKTPYLLNSIEKNVKNLQKIFPYHVFFSPEFIGNSACSVCGTIVTPRKKCMHKKGEIYNGEMCIHIIRQLSFIGSAITKNPVQKYSVVFLEGQDQHNYEMVDFFSARVNSPFDKWELKITTQDSPHENFSTLSNNSLCPCGSESTYFTCCYHKPSVLVPHYVLNFDKIIIPSDKKDLLRKKLPTLTSSKLLEDY